MQEDVDDEANEENNEYEKEGELEGKIITLQALEKLKKGLEVNWK